MAKLTILVFFTLLGFGFSLLVGHLSDNALVTSTGLVAFVLFFAFALYRLRSELISIVRSRSFQLNASSFLVALLSLIFVGFGVWWFSLPENDLTLDLTASKQNSLSPASEEIIDKIDLFTEKNAVEIQIEGFFSDPLLEGRYAELIQLFERAGLNVKYRFYNPVRHPDKVLAYGISSPNIAVLKMGEKRFLMDRFDEAGLSSFLLKVLNNETPLVCFSQGHGESLLSLSHPYGLSKLSDFLESMNYKLESQDQENYLNEDSSCRVVVLAGMRFDPEKAFLDRLAGYLARGGSLFVAVDAAVELPRMNTFLAELGVELGRDLLLLPEGDVRASLFGQQYVVVNEFDDFSTLTRSLSKRGIHGGGQILAPFTRSVHAVSSHHVLSSREVMKTAINMQRIREVTRADDLERVDPEKIEKGQYPVMVTSIGRSEDVLSIIQKPNESPARSGKGGKESASIEGSANEKEIEEDRNRTKKGKSHFRVVVLGSSHLLNNSGIEVSQVNKILLTNIFSYLTDPDSDPISTSSMEGDEALVLSGKYSHYLLIGLCFIYPCMFLGFGVWGWNKRRFT